MCAAVGRVPVLAAATREADIGLRGRALEGRVCALRAVGAMATGTSADSAGMALANVAARSGSAGTPWELIAEHTNTLGLLGYPAATSIRSEHSPTALWKTFGSLSMAILYAGSQFGAHSPLKSLNSFTPFFLPACLGVLHALIISLWYCASVCILGASHLSTSPFSPRTK